VGTTSTSLLLSGIATSVLANTHHFHTALISRHLPCYLERGFLKGSGSCSPGLNLEERQQLPPGFPGCADGAAESDERSAFAELSCRQFAPLQPDRQTRTRAVEHTRQKVQCRLVSTAAWKRMRPPQQGPPS